MDTVILGKENYVAENEEAVTFIRSLPPPDEAPYLADDVTILHVPNTGTTIEELTDQRWMNRPSLGGMEVRDAIKKATGGLGYQIFMSDKKYLEYGIDEVQRFILADDVNSKLYIKEYFDCDDFAMVLAGRIKGTMIGIPFGVIWYYGIKNRRVWGHAVNIFYDAKLNEIFLIEPQTDIMYAFNKNWRAKLILI